MVPHQEEHVKILDDFDSPTNGRYDANRQSHLH
jgi:hypothetical protein